MSKVFAVTALAAAVFVALAAATSGSAQPVANEHEHFVSDPYDDNWCGIDGTSVSSGVAHYLEDASGRSVETVNVTTLFTATDTGKTIEIRKTGARMGSGPIDNGDGTYSVIATNVGQSPSFMIPNGPPLVLGVGLVQFVLTFDSATGDFLSFDVVKTAGQRVPGCDALVAYLLDP
jgi:hypothetical protein